MSGRGRGFAALAAYLILALALWAGAAWSLEGLSGAVLEMRWHGGGLTAAALDIALNDAGQTTRAAAWSIRQGVAAEGLREGRVSVARAHGDANLLCGGAALSGNLTGCSVSLKTARALWGADDPTGRTLMLDGERFAVRGVFRRGKADVVLAGEKEGEAGFSCLALAFPDAPPGDWRALAASFAPGLGLGEADDLLDAPLYATVARFCARLPLWTLILLAAAWQLRAMKRGEKPSVRCLRILALPLSLCALFWAAGVRFEIPRWLLPTRWSDFAFWQKAFAALGERFAALVRAQLTPIDEANLYAALRALLMGAASGFCLARASGRLKTIIGG